jgi:hypothetical protein
MLISAPILQTFLRVRQGLEIEASSVVNEKGTTGEVERHAHHEHLQSLKQGSQFL